MPNFLLYSYLGYIVLLLAALLAHVWWRKRGRKSKIPFDQKTVRVMRTPGESARKKIEFLSDQIVENMFMAFLAPIAMLLSFQLVFLLVHAFGVQTKNYVVFLPITCLVVLAIFVRRITKAVLERSDWYLGHFGERNVADNLDALRERGWRIFHDVPAERKGKKFNVDHVAVGPGGVFAIETKTPRRPETPRAGKDAHVVRYDGERLYWPTGIVDEQKPRMAKSRADWLHDWLTSKGVRVAEVAPILAIPWWYVKKADEKTEYAIPAVHPGQLVGILTSRPRTLSDPDVSKISSLLRAHCCDVEY